MAKTRISQSFRSHNDPPLIVAGVETLKHWAQWNINSLMVKYVQIWNRILSQKKLVGGQCPGIGSWIVSFRIPIFFITQEGLFIKFLDWSLLYIEQHSDNLRKITLQMIWNVLSDYEQISGIAAL